MAEKGQRRDPTGHRTPAQVKRKDRGYNARPENIKKRSMNNKARAMLKKEGVDVKGRDVHHKKPLRSGGSNSRSNLAVASRAKNRAHGSPAGGRATKKSTR